MMVSTTIYIYNKGNIPAYDSECAHRHMEELILCAAAAHCIRWHSIDPQRGNSSAAAVKQSKEAGEDKLHKIKAEFKV